MTPANSIGFGSLVLQFARAFLRHCLKRLAAGSPSPAALSPPASAEPVSPGRSATKSRNEISRAYRLCAKQAEYLLKSDVISDPVVQHAYVQARCFMECFGWLSGVPDHQKWLPSHLDELEKAELLMDANTDQNECAGR